MLLAKILVSKNEAVTDNILTISQLLKEAEELHNITLTAEIIEGVSLWHGKYPGNEEIIQVWLSYNPLRVRDTEHAMTVYQWVTNRLRVVYNQHCVLLYTMTTDVYASSKN